MEIFEHITFKSNLSLEEFTERLSEQVFLTQKFQYDYENENNWSRAFDEDHIEINISKPFEEGTLQEWDSTVPEGCNFGIALCSSDEIYNYENDKLNQGFVLEKLIPKYIKLVEIIINSNAYYHRGNYFKQYKELKNL
ncbi:hypothetical protein [Paenibacillus sp. FSL H7-0331]|uniref:hypothetical protein n=1 Tax=Paenibacillus sp. FSL H7-0331 TaxID=1920421 RepID=UPI00096E2363|nr:hypothetical protein [Paenibacillus sp. FSL H7-0331]OMF02621.1 hypothetical protein BK127_37065 [Paenibacillus sp. FSL H7-0331]